MSDNMWNRVALRKELMIRVKKNKKHRKRGERECGRMVLKKMTREEERVILQWCERKVNQNNRQFKRYKYKSKKKKNTKEENTREGEICYGEKTANPNRNWEKKEKRLRHQKWD